MACAAVHAACRAEYTLCGTFTGSLDGARAKREKGYRMVVTANDMDVIGRGFAQATTGFAARAPAAPPSRPPPAETRPAKSEPGKPEPLGYGEGAPRRGPAQRTAHP